MPLYRPLFFALSLLIVTACGNQNKHNMTGEKDTKKNTLVEKHLWVNGALIPCEGEGKMQCMLVQEGETWQPGEWEFMYDGIEGFTYEIGSLYHLLVTEEKLAPETVPADASSIRTKLVKVITKEPAVSSRLHDIWALTHLNGTPIEISTNRPTLEINLTTGKVMGNAGCNQYFGPVKKATETELMFDRLASTKKMCPQMKMEDAFLAALQETATYQIKKLTLLLFDKDQKELLRFQKVD